MSLLRQIQNDAVNPNVNVSDLLRKCKILAYRLGSEQLNDWINFELEGYPQATEYLPDYRILRNVISQGRFVGTHGREAIGVNIPLFRLPKEEYDHLSQMRLYENIAVLVGWTNSSEAAVFEDWNSVILARYGRDIYPEMQCIEAYKIVDINLIKGISDLIRTKILNFALEIEMLNKDAGDVEINSNPIPQDKISQIFNINISGNVQNLASGNHHSTINQSISNNIPQDFLELLTKVQSSDLDAEIAKEISEKIENLGLLIGTPEYKNAYTELMNFASSHVTVFTFLEPYIGMLTNYLT